MNNLLPWKNFNWCAISTRGDDSRVMIYGIVQLDEFPTNDTISIRSLDRAAQAAHEIGIAWDPFNVQLMVIPSRLGSE